jgi:APA family basic amino acid/polyamine antiporter
LVLGFRWSANVEKNNRMTSSSDAVPVPSLKRQIGLASATAAVASESIAVGIFLTPAGMAKSLGSPFWLLVIWLSAGTLAICGALCYGELAARYPRNGGIYIYLLETFGPSAAFLYGWMCLLVLDPGLTAALATGMASYAAYIVPLSAAGAKAVAIAVIWALCILNFLSVRVSAGVLRWSTWLKLGILAFLVLLALVFRMGAWSNFSPLVAQRSGSLPLGPALAMAMVGAFFTFGGWWDVSKIAGEVRDPGRNLPLAMIFGVLIVTAVYVVVSGVFLYLVPLAKVTSDETFVAQAGAILFGTAGGKIFAAIVVICIVSSLAALIMFAPRVYYAMAENGVFPRTIGRLHSRFGTPAKAILVQGSVASVLVIFGSFQRIIAYFIFAAVVFLTLAGAGLFVARSRNTEKLPAFAAPAYPLPLAVFLVLMCFMMALLLLHSPREALLGAVVVLSGLPVYKIFSRKSRATPVYDPLTAGEFTREA